MRWCRGRVLVPTSKEMCIYGAFYSAWQGGSVNRGKHMWKECRVNSCLALSPLVHSAGEFGLSQLRHGYINLSWNSGFGVFSLLPWGVDGSAHISQTCFPDVAITAAKKGSLPYLYRLQSLRNTKMITSPRKINGAPFMRFSTSREPDFAYKGLLKQLPGYSTQWIFHCLLFHVQEILT